MRVAAPCPVCTSLPLLPSSTCDKHRMSSCLIWVESTPPAEPSIHLISPPSLPSLPSSFTASLSGFLFPSMSPLPPPGTALISSKCHPGLHVTEVDRTLSTTAMSDSACNALPCLPPSPVKFCKDRIIHLSAPSEARISTPYLTVLASMALIPSLLLIPLSELPLPVPLFFLFPLHGGHRTYSADGDAATTSCSDPVLMDAVTGARSTAPESPSPRPDTAEVAASSREAATLALPLAPSLSLPLHPFLSSGP